MSNPYASPSDIPMVQTGQTSHGKSDMAPLHDATFFIQFIAWFNIIGGVLYALTIVGIIFAWVPIWIGICLKNAADGLKQGQATGSPAHYNNAARNLSTMFKIVGVLMIIQTVILVLYFVFIIGMLFLGIGAAAMDA